MSIIAPEIPKAPDVFMGGYDLWKDEYKSFVEFLDTIAVKYDEKSTFFFDFEEDVQNGHIKEVKHLLVRYDSVPNSYYRNYMYNGKIVRVEFNTTTDKITAIGTNYFMFSKFMFGF